MEWSITTDSLTATGREFVTAGDLVPARIRIMLETARPEVEGASTVSIFAVTPKGRDDEEAGRLAGALARSTKADSILTDDTLTTEAYQDAVSRSNMDGTGGGVNYGEIVRKGRGAIDAKPGGVMRFMGGDGESVFRGYVKGVSANPYQEEAAGPIRSAVAAILTEQSAIMARHLLVAA